MRFFKMAFAALFLLSFNPSAFSAESREAEFLAVQTYAEMAIQWRKDMRDLYEQMYLYGNENSGKIKASHLEKLVQSLRYFDLKIQRPLTELGHQDVNFIGSNDFFEIRSNGKTKISNASRKISLTEARRLRNSRRNGFRFNTIRVKRYQINPKDEKGLDLVRAFQVQFLSKLLSMDNYLLGIAPFMGNKKFRKVIMKQIPLRFEGTSENIHDLWFAYVNDLYKSDALFDARDLYLDYAKIEGDKKITDMLINQVIESSITFNELKSSSRLNILGDTLKTVQFMTMRRNSAIETISSETLYALSKAFGNTAGLFQSRHGKLFNMSKEEERELKKQFKPLDVLMEKTPFRLTDKFIPGHWGHSAVWVGTEKELRELGVWDKLPQIYEEARKNFGYNGPTFQEMVKSGHHIVEALRPGIEINTMRHFLEIDDLAAVRIKDCGEEGLTRDQKGNITCLTDEIKKKYLIKAFQQIGKDYDFNFDVNTERQIVCSELPFRVFLDVDFETSLTVGRYSISPDQVAKMAVGPNKIFHPFLIYFDGERVDREGDELNPVLEALLKRQYDKVQDLTGIEYNP